MERYGWNTEKERINVWKHGVSFLEAESVVDNPSSRTRHDELHSVREHRLITVGWSSMGRLLVVITSDGGPRPRIISA